jgi:TonB family protein
MKRTRRTKKAKRTAHIGRGFLLAVLLHSTSLGPLIALAVVLGAREAAEREQEVDVSWKEIDPETLPTDLPPLSPDEPPAPKAKEAEPKPKVAEEDVKPEPKAEEDPAKPQDEPKPEPQPLAEQPPPAKPDVQKQHEKIVEIDPDKDEPPPDKANFLANKNSRAEKETRAQETNLEKNRKGDQQSSPSDEKAGDPGDAESKIAQLEETPSKTGRRAPAVTPSANPREATAQTKQTPTVLSMRSVEKQSHTITPETVNPFLSRSPDGTIALPNRDQHAKQDMASRAGPQMDARLKLSADDYDYLFGQDDNAAKALAQKARSTRKGKFTQRLEQGRSALENFIPEVQPGNQTALNARAAPFASFLANMHRTIHQLWGWGFLSDLEGRSPSDPLNNMGLWTRLEIVLNADGTIDNVKVIRTSGLSMFDVAAVDVIHSSGPYPEPPREIHSANGKVYLHWAFHRDERQCATFGADPFILNNPGQPTDHNQALSVAKAPRIPGQKTPPPRPLSRSQVPTGQSAESPIEESLGGAKPPAVDLAKPNDPLARQVAENFFLGLVTADVRQTIKWVGFPFHSSAGNTTPSASELLAQLQGLVDELPKPRKLRSLNIYTSAGLRSAGISPPADFSTNPRALYAIALAGGETLIAPMLPHMGAWKVMGLYR